MPATSVQAPPDFGRVGFVGLGDMGGPMADNLVAAGFQVSVFDQRPEPLRAAQAKGAAVAQSLVELADACGTIGICVWSDDQLTDAVLGPQGLLRSQAPQRTLIVHSTVRPRTIEAIARAFAPRGWSVLDAPVSGGRPASLSGTLTLMVGAEPTLYQRNLPYFKTVGQHLFHVGPRAGLGEVAKLCNNLMALCNVQAAVEGLKLGAAYGIPEDTVLKVAQASTGDSWYARNWGFVDTLLRTHPQEDVLYKDLHEALDAAESQGVQLLLTRAAAATAPCVIGERKQRLEGAPATSAAGESPQQALDSVLADWSAAGSRWDPDAFAAIYAQEAVLFGGRPGHSVGRDGVRAYFASYVGVIASARLHMHEHQVFQLTPELVQAQGFGTFELVLADGQVSRSTMRGTLTLVRRKGRWLILQHHFSTTPEIPPLR